MCVKCLMCLMCLKWPLLASDGSVSGAYGAGWWSVSGTDGTDGTSRSMEAITSGMVSSIFDSSPNRTYGGGFDRSDPWPRHKIVLATNITPSDAPCSF